MLRASVKVDFATLNFGNYSTTEQDTGFTWVDGKKIYKKSIYTGSLPTAGGTTNIDIGVNNLDKIINLQGIVWYSNGITLPLPYASPATNGTSSVSCGINANKQISILAGTDRSGAAGYVTLYYTKTS